MNNVENELIWRLSFFFGGLLLFLALGKAKAFRNIPSQLLKRRWTNNILLTLFNSIFIRLLIPTSVSAWFLNYPNSWALLPKLIQDPIAQIILGILFLDAIIYFQHRTFHRIPFLWRLHRVHHTDIEFDASTALRFHPIEILISLGIKLVAVIALGLSPTTLFLFEIILNFSALFNHSNFSLPTWVERPLHLFVITPDMHRIHHSVIRNETDSNFGFFLSIWDRLFLTYTRTPTKNPQDMPIGIEHFRSLEDQSFWMLLKQPFTKNH